MSAMTEEEQLDRLKSSFKKYGSTALSGVLIALIGFFGWQYWQKNNLAASQNQTARVQQFMDQANAAGNNPNAYGTLAASADKIVQADPDSVQAVQSQMVMAKAAYDKGDYAAAERELQKVQNAKLKDAGLIAIVNMNLADAQLAQKKFDDALKTLALVTEPTFKATVEEARGDVFVAKKDIENAKKAYQSAWNTLVEQKEERQILQIKLESVGVLVDDPELERPIIQPPVDES
ncbi:putative negative regulator of RcsB-dependent stress response [Acinetobacter calcoaceticus]|uniref:Ancillary SecYEG translocon subunit n=1 Tax=Acinetobacter calcoaceticus TaxID=471 RepID=A0A4R1XH05_ACICA|nr:putative negative regulator of RcsB-dependent stress response [Acinetobacter calcoaceticus]